MRKRALLSWFAAAVLVTVYSVASVAHALDDVPPRANTPWHERVERLQADYESDPHAPQFSKWYPIAHLDDEPVRSVLEAAHQSGVLTEWWCNDDGDYDEWDEVWMAIIAETIRAGAEAYVYLHSAAGDDPDEADTFAHCRQLLEDVEGIDANRVHWIRGRSTDGFWIRDFGPLFVRGVVSDTLSIQDPRYYDTRPLNDGRPVELARDLGVEVGEFPVNLEGGNFLPNGGGLCLVGSVVLGANPQYSLSELEDLFAVRLGCEELVILNSLRDYATGHIDMWLSWADQTTLVVGEYERAQDPLTYDAIEDNVERWLEGRVDPETGQPIRIVRMPMPSNCPAVEGEAPRRCRVATRDRVWRSYVNVLQINGTVLVPVYKQDDEYEDDAVEIWKSLGYRVRRVPSDPVIEGEGSIHCLTKNVPAPRFVAHVVDAASGLTPVGIPAGEGVREPWPLLRARDAYDSADDATAGCTCSANPFGGMGWALAAMLALSVLGMGYARRLHR